MTYSIKDPEKAQGTSFHVHLGLTSDSPYQPLDGSITHTERPQCTPRQTPTNQNLSALSHSQKRMTYSFSFLTTE